MTIEEAREKVAKARVKIDEAEARMRELGPSRLCPRCIQSELGLGILLCARHSNAFRALCKARANLGRIVLPKVEDPEGEAEKAHESIRVPVEMVTSAFKQPVAVLAVDPFAD